MTIRIRNTKRRYPAKHHRQIFHASHRNLKIPQRLIRESIKSKAPNESISHRERSNQARPRLSVIFLDNIPHAHRPPSPSPRVKYYCSWLGLGLEEGRGKRASTRSVNEVSSAATAMHYLSICIIFAVTFLPVRYGQKSSGQKRYTRNRERGGGGSWHCMCAEEVERRNTQGTRDNITHPFSRGYPFEKSLRDPAKQEYKRASGGGCG